MAATTLFGSQAAAVAGTSSTLHGASRDQGGVAATATPTTASGDASYTAQNLPEWAIGPFTRSSVNPVMTPSGSGFEAAATYNPGVLYRDGEYQMLYRAQPTRGGPSQIGYATSQDGVHFTQDTAANPVISIAQAGEQDKCGLEDPRLYELDGTYYSFFTSVHPRADGSCYGSYNISESVSTDLVHWSTPVVVEPDTGSNKDAAVVTDPTGTPVKIHGQYVMYFGQGNTGTYIAYSSDLRHWHASGTSAAGTADTLDVHYPAGFQPWEVCVAVTDYQTVKGAPTNHDIDLFTAGTLMANGRWFYAISEAEFSGQDPTQMLHQLSDAVLTPTPDIPYEWNGQTPKTVWTNSILFHDGQWSMYYGGGDTVTGLATAPLRRAAPPRSGTTPLSTGFEHGQPLPDWVDSVDTSPAGGVANVVPYGSASGLESSLRQEVEHDGTNALMYSGQATGAPDDYAYMRILDLSDRPIPVGQDTTLSYWIYPQAQGPKAPDVSGDNSSCVALDPVFADGRSYDQLAGATGTPQSQCGQLALDTWDHVTIDLGKVAADHQVVRLDLGYDQPGGQGGYRGYVDDIAVTNAPQRPATITGISPQQAAPGQPVTITGSGFGAYPTPAHLLLSDNGVSWGGVGDLGTLHVDSWSPTAITFTVPKPSGPAVSTQSGPMNIWRAEPGTTASVAVVTGPSSYSNTEQFTVGDSDVLSDYTNDIGISVDSNPGCGAYDSGTDTYSATALSGASPNSLTPGSQVTVGGLNFTWPDVAACNNDNVRVEGQTILLAPHPGASEIGFLGSATNGSQSGTVTITYTDGTTSTATLSQTDWGQTPGPGNVEVAHMTYRNTATGQQAHDFYVDEQSIPTDPSRTVASITLPQQPNMHIFAISQG